MSPNLRASLRAAALLVVGVSIAACSPPDRRGPDPAGGDPLLRANYPNVVVMEQLAPYIVVSEPVVERTEVGSLRVSVPVRAATRVENLNTQYRFDFLDEQGRPIRPEQSWRFIQLPSRTQRFLEATSLDDRAVDWRLEIRPGH